MKSLNNAEVTIFGGCIIAFILYTVATFYAHPIADDYLNSFYTRQNSIYYLWKQSYFSWGGRYFVHFLVYLNPLAFDSLTGYVFFLFLMVLFTPLIFYYFLDTIFQNKFSFLKKIYFSFIIALLFFHLMPSLSEGFYWFTSTVSYQLATFLSIIFLIFFYKWYQQDYLIKSFNFFFLVLLIISIIGCTEIHLVHLDFFIGILFLIYLFKDKKVHLPILVLLIIAAFFSLINILAPGNMVRGGHFSNTGNFFYSTYMSILQTGRFLLKWVFSPLLIISTLIFVKEDFESNRIFSNRIKISPLIIFIPLCALIFFSAFLPYWATGIQGQHRTVNAANHMFIIFWFVFIAALIHQFPKLFRLLYQNTFRVQPYFPLVFCISLFFTGNTITLIKDFSYGRIQKYHELFVNREDYLTNLPSETKIVYLNTLKKEEIPKSLFVADINKDSCNWVNLGYVLFYDLEECGVRLKTNKEKIDTFE